MMLRTVVPIAALAVLLSGCATVIKVAFEPTTPAKPLRAAKMPQLYLESIAVNPDAIKSWSLTRNPPQFDPPVEDALRDVIGKELGRLGISLAANRLCADALLRVELAKGEFKVASLEKPAGDLTFVLTLKAHSGHSFWQQTVKGTATGESVWVTDPVVSTLFSQCVTMALEQMGGLFEAQNVAAEIFSAEAVSPRPAAAAAQCAAPALAAAPTPAAAASDSAEEESLEPAKVNTPDFGADDRLVP